uniref:Uncharacterized protein n=1 Tax=Octopus bimaculoides TaxID=37653 RepID=A0A0L8FVN0_OCTBM
MFNSWNDQGSHLICPCIFYTEENRIYLLMSCLRNYQTFSVHMAFCSLKG